MHAIGFSTGNFSCKTLWHNMLCLRQYGGRITIMKEGQIQMKGETVQNCNLKGRLSYVGDLPANGKKIEAVQELVGAEHEVIMGDSTT